MPLQTPSCIRTCIFLIRGSICPVVLVKYDYCWKYFHLCDYDPCREAILKSRERNQRTLFLRKKKRQQQSICTLLFPNWAWYQVNASFHPLMFCFSLLNLHALLCFIHLSFGIVILNNLNFVLMNETLWLSSTNYLIEINN